MSHSNPKFFNVDKDPAAILDYQFDWSQWLASCETILTSTWTVDPPAWPKLARRWHGCASLHRRQPHHHQRRENGGTNAQSAYD